MNIVIGLEAREDLRQIEKPIRKEIGNEIEDLKEKPIPKNSMPIPLFNGEQVQRLKLQEEDRNSKLNHRVIYDIEDKTIYIYGIWHREVGYTEMKENVAERK